MNQDGGMSSVVVITSQDDNTIENIRMFNAKIRDVQMILWWKQSDVNVG